MRRALLVLVVGCADKSDQQSPEPEPEDSAQPDTADSGEDSGEDSGDSGDTAPPVDTVDTAPPKDTVDTVDTSPVDPGVDCDNLPPLPVMFKLLPGFTTAEDFTFDGDGNYLAFDGPLVSIDYTGTRTVLVPMGGGFYSAGMHMLADGDVVVNNVGENSVMRVGLDGSKEVILSGVSYPNGITVSVDNVVYVSGHGDGNIYEVDPDTHDYTVIAGGLSYANGMAFSPDNQTLYVCSFSLGTIWAIDRDGKGGWHPTRVLHDLPVALDGLNVDECGNVYVSDYTSGKIWRVDPDDKPTVAQIVATVPAFWIPNMHWGRGLGGFETDILYVANRDTGALIALEVGVGSTPQAFVPGK